MLNPEIPALILAPMDGVTDAPMRALQGEMGAFSFAVSEFVRVSSEAPPQHVFLRHVPELQAGAITPSGLPVQVQLLGGDPDRMALAAQVAVAAGATAIDINFGCPAPTVNRHDGGATLLKYPDRIQTVVAAVRAATPVEIPVSAKLRLGWDSTDAILENAARAAEGGASWLTIHGRTRLQGYAPPVAWEPIGIVRERLSLPIVANGDIWSVADFRRCREETGCLHYMLGRGALADPRLPMQIAQELGIERPDHAYSALVGQGWVPRLQRLVDWTQFYGECRPGPPLRRIKQWLNMAARFGSFTGFDAIKRAQTIEEIVEIFALLLNVFVSSPYERDSA